MGNTDDGQSCVGTNWCRYGVGDSVGMAIRLEERYKSIRAPHKIKGGVSGCVRECAEAQSKEYALSHNSLNSPFTNMALALALSPRKRGTISTLAETAALNPVTQSS